MPQIIGAPNTQNSDYQLTLADLNGFVRMNSANPNQLIVPPDGVVNFTIGTVITIRQVGAGTTTITPGTGVSITSPSTLSLRSQYSTVQIIKVAQNSWELAGDVS